MIGDLVKGIGDVQWFGHVIVHGMSVGRSVDLHRRVHFVDDELLKEIPLWLGLPTNGTNQSNLAVLTSQRTLIFISMSIDE